MMSAIATGSSRLVATPRSTEHQVSRMPSAMIGSGRRPLFRGSQKARNIPAAVHAAARLIFTAWPSRGITSRLMIHQHASPISRVGSRIHTLEVDDVCPHREKVVVPTEGRFRRAEPPVVVGHVAGVLGHPRHRQDVAVVGRVGADEVPPHHHRGDHAVERGQRPPPRRQESSVSHPVRAVQDVQCAEGDHGQRDAEDHREHLEQRRRRAVPGVDGGRERQARWRRPREIGEDADDLGAEVVPAALAAQWLVGVGRIGRVVVRIRAQAHELARDLVRVGGERQLLALRAEHLVHRCGDDRGVADDHQEVLADPFDQQSAVDGLRRLLRHGGQQHGLGGVLGTGEARRRLAGHGDRQVGGDVADQRGVDALPHAVLGPVELGRGLGDGEQRGGDREHRAEQSGDDGDEPRGSVTVTHRRFLHHGPRY